MAYTLSFALDYGIINLNLKAALFSSGIIDFAFRDVTSTFFSDGQGSYEFVSSQIPNSYQGMIVFYTGNLNQDTNFNNVTIYSCGSINPQETENSNIKTSDVVDNVFSTILPGDYEDNSVGEILSRFNIGGPTTSLIVIPGAPVSNSKCRIFFYPKGISTDYGDIEVNFTLFPAREISSEGYIMAGRTIVWTWTPETMWIDLERNDLMQSAQSEYYIVSSQALGFNNAKLILDSETKDLADLIAG